MSSLTDLVVKINAYTLFAYKFGFGHICENVWCGCILVIRRSEMQMRLHQIFFSQTQTSVFLSIIFIFQLSTPEIKYEKKTLLFVTLSLCPLHRKWVHIHSLATNVNSNVNESQLEQSYADMLLIYEVCLKLDFN